MQTVETLNEGLKRAYTLTITAKDIDKRVEAELKTVAPQVRMPGFRPGKVPANLVRKMHGPALQQDALNSSIQEGVQKILADNKLRPAMQPSVELAEGYEPGKDAQITVSLEVLPQVPTPQIDGLKLERLTVPVTDAQIDEAVARIAAQNKSWDDAKPTYKAKTGDLVTMDFVGKVGGEEFAGGKGEGMAIEIGSGQLIPGFEDQLVGVKANDEKTIEVTFPENYNAKHLAGKPATFDLVITAVKTPKETVADEEFAKALGLEGLDQLRELFKGQIEQEHNGLTRTHMKRRLLDQLAAAHDFDVPPSMVEAEFNQIWAQLEHEAGHEEDPEAARAEMEKDREDYRAIAVRRVRLGLLLSEIGQANGVEVSQQEMNRLVQQAAQQYNPQDRERFVQYIQQEPMAAAQLRAPLYEDKVVDFLFSKAEISEREVTREDIEAEIESEDDAGHVHGPGCGHDHHDHDHAKPKAAKKAAPKKAVSEDAKAEASAKPAAKKAAPKKAAAAEDAPAPAKKPAAKKAEAAKDEAPAKAKPAAKKPAAKKTEG
ncbi:trigger factor [Sphingomonas flavalba]|uniref:trigger factor n=1 Tax=Sphingomonas flavalba TaxID=2559804 RepID=UPI0039DF5EE9